MRSVEAWGGDEGSSPSSPSSPTSSSSSSSEQRAQRTESRRAQIDNLVNSLTNSEGKLDRTNLDALTKLIDADHDAEDDEELDQEADQADEELDNAIGSHDGAVPSSPAPRGGGQSGPHLKPEPRTGEGMPHTTAPAHHPRDGPTSRRPRQRFKPRR